MTRNTMIVALAVAVVVVIAAVGVTLWRTTTTEEQATDSHVHLDDPRTADPTTAATGTMTGLLTWDPATQDGPWDAAAAISDRLTGSLAEYAASDGGGEPLPEKWEVWATGGDRVRGLATVSPDSREIPDTAEVATITVDVEQRVQHPSGGMTPLTRGVVDVSVELIDGDWKTSEYTYLSIDY
ncbi:hypothetical protein [Corynebacterium sp. A21]|uniref:hypothetical protein n=1 Tax=Corynebacterium sp. A21 TaxID=3457318 RepID=UPI003FD121D9